MILRKLIQQMLSAATVVGLLGAASPAAAETKLLFNSFAPSSEIFAAVIKPWLEDIETVTEGRVKIVVPPQSMAAPPEQMNMVANGIADGGFIVNAFLQKSHPLMQIGFLPGTMTSALQDSVAYWRTYEKFIEPKQPINEVKLLGLFSTPPGYLYNTKDTPIQSMSDMAGAKTWSLPGITAAAIGATGAAVVPGPAARVYEVISNGIVDHFCCVHYTDLKSMHVLQYLGASTEVEGGVFSAKFSVFFNKDKWNSISPEDQAAIMKISGEALARRAAVMDESNQAARQEYLDNGGVIATASPEFNAELKKAWQPLVDEWIASANAAGVDGQAALDYFKSQKVEIAK